MTSVLALITLVGFGVLLVMGIRKLESKQRAAEAAQRLRDQYADK